MKRFIKFIILCITGLSCSLQAAEFTKDPLDLVRSNISEKKAVLIDVREKDEWDDGHIKGAVLLPLSRLEKGITKTELDAQISAEKIIYVHCVVGQRAKTAANILEKQGYKVRVLKAGYEELVKEGLPNTK